MKNLTSKILKVMSEVTFVSKDKEFKASSSFRYKYASDAAIVTSIRDAMIKHGLTALPSVKECIKEEHKNSKGELFFFTTVKVDYCLTDSDSGEHVVTTIYGQGQDKGDKGVYKAMTGAEKYYFLKTFLIPTTDDPEQDVQTTQTRQDSEKSPRHPRHNGASIKQVGMLAGLLAERQCKTPEGRHAYYKLKTGSEKLTGQSASKLIGEFLGK